jgi:hypothetical protein
VLSLGSDTIEFETIYGSGTLRISLEDIEDIDTAVPMRVYFGESDETVAGRLVGVRDGLLVVGEDPTTQVSVDLADIRYGIAQPRYEESFFRRLRSDFREWNVEFDLPRCVEARLYPTAGLGYRIFDSERATLQPKLGFGYVYEDFADEGGNSNTGGYASGFLGLDGSYTWDTSVELRGRLGYWPGLASPGKNWLFRSELTATVPIWDPLAFRTTIVNINGNNPAPDTGNNKFHTIMGLALRFRTARSPLFVAEKRTLGWRPSWG